MLFILSNNCMPNSLMRNSKMYKYVKRGSHASIVPKRSRMRKFMDEMRFYFMESKIS